MGSRRETVNPEIFPKRITSGNTPAPQRFHNVVHTLAMGDGRWAMGAYIALNSSNGCAQFRQNQIALHAVDPNSLRRVVFCDLQ